jgi:predicted nuclease of predicted toxin-antitoxin system
VPTALRLAGAVCYVHDDHFASDAPDEVWLQAAGRAGWSVLTKDTKIRYRDTERAALIAAKVRAFVITTGDLTGAEMATMVVAALPAIARLCQRTAPPFIARIGKGGRVYLLFKG